MTNHEPAVQVPPRDPRDDPRWDAWVEGGTMSPAQATELLTGTPFEPQMSGQSAPSRLVDEANVSVPEPSAQDIARIATRTGYHPSIVRKSLAKDPHVFDYLYNHGSEL